MLKVKYVSQLVGSIKNDKNHTSVTWTIVQDEMRFFKPSISGEEFSRTQELLNRKINNCEITNRNEIAYWMGILGYRLHVPCARQIISG